MELTDETKMPLYVLLAEDSRVQAQLVEIIFEEVPEVELAAVVEDGSDALAYLRREEPYANSQPPDLVLLDINMPNVDGFEVLSQMKNDPALRTIPVVMLTTSTDDEDVVKSYEDGASTFMQKPVDVEKMREMLNKLADRWPNSKPR